MSPDPSTKVDNRTAPETGTERRAHERYELDLDGDLSRDGQQFVPCRVHDFCLGGMLLIPTESSAHELIVAGKPVASDDKLVVRCSAEVAGERHEHSVRVRVASVSNRGIGVSFDRDDANEIWRITQFVRKLKEVVLEQRARDRQSRAPSSPMAVEQAVNAGQLLEDARRRIEKFLVSGVDSSFQQADDWLFAQANAAPSNTKGADFSNAMSELKGLKLSVESAFIDAMDRGLTALGKPASQSVPRTEDDNDSELALLDTGRFDDWLVAKNIISAAEPRLQQSQFDLEQRLSRLVNTVIDEDNNPIGLVPLCLAFHESIQDLGASRIARHAMLHGFDKAVAGKLDSLYDELNTMLVEGGVLPSIEGSQGLSSVPVDAASADEEGSTKSRDSAEPEPATSDAGDTSAASDESGASVEPGPAASDAGGDTASLEPATSEVNDVPPTADTESQPPSDSAYQTASTAAPGARPGNAFRAASTLIALQSEVDPAVAAEIGQFTEGLDKLYATPSPTPITLEQQSNLFDNLSILQRSPRFAQSSESGPLDLKQKLRTTWQSAGLKVGEHERMTAAIVSNLVDAILEDPFLNEETKVRVRRLAVPILKVALQDDGFFNDQTHPARQVLDSLGGIEPGSAESLVKIIDPVVDGIVGGYDKDPKVFSDALGQLKSALSEQRKNFQQNLEKIAAEREGQQAFLKARQNKAGAGAKPKKASKSGVDTDATGSGVWSRWLALAKRCEPGDVLSMEEQDGSRKKLILAWVSGDKGTFVLADSQGNKAMSLTAQELAMHIKRGTASVEETGNMALTDRGTYRMLRSLHKRLSRNASHDRLTDVLKRKEFEARLENLITEAVRDATRHVMYGLQIDGLKHVVEIAGKKTATHLLRKLAQVIDKQVAKRGIVGRLGAARFGVLIDNTTVKEARKLVERQCQTLMQIRPMWHGEVLPLTVGAGIVEITPASQGVTATLADLESAVKTAVKAGENRIEIASSVDDPYEEQGLMGAGSDTVLDMLDTNRLRLRCQRVVPLVESLSSKPHYEILLGVQQDDHTVSLPTDFIRAAERNHEMQTVDRWVIRTMFQWIRDNPQKLHDADGYSINLSANALSDEGVLEFVLNQFSEIAIPPAKVMFEFSETAAAANVAFTTDFVTTLKAYGCRFAIDNFGMAESSFSFLRSLPVDFVKISGRLVVDILENSKDLAVLKSINEIGHLLGKKTIAEFVENEALLSRVRELGVDYAQGFGIEEPCLLESI